MKPYVSTASMCSLLPALNLTENNQAITNGEKNKENKSFTARRKREEHFKKRQQEQKLKDESEENRRRAERIRRAELMKKLDINDIYEYDVIVLRDRENGGIDVDALRETLASYGEEGWHLVNTITNGIGSVLHENERLAPGSRVFLEETILIFERCIKRASFEE